MTHSSEADIIQATAHEDTWPVTIRERARAKVNLTLHVKGKRPDGYHELESLVVFANDVADELEFSPDIDDRLEIDGAFAPLLEGDNLIMKAKRAVAEWFDMDIHGHFRLRKNIPVAAGLGGGSSDAAATIRALVAIYGENRKPEEFIEASKLIGADVPVCLYGRAAWMCGLGERITPVPRVAPLPAILVNPRIKLSTADVFRTLAARPLASGEENAPFSVATDWDSPEGAAECLAHGRNDLEAPAIALEPQVARVLDTVRALDGCVLSRLSGSGPTCFGVFVSAEKAKAAAGALAAAHPNWWVAPTVLA